jgi:hypothetical protein
LTAAAKKALLGLRKAHPATLTAREIGVRSASVCLLLNPGYVVRGCVDGIRDSYGLTPKGLEASRLLELLANWKARTKN